MTALDRLFNSQLETGIRAVVVLESIRPMAVDMTELVLLDHLVVHTADIGGPASLHPDVPARKGELLVRRDLLKASIDLMRRCHLVDQVPADEGILYRASDEAATYVDLLESKYSAHLKDCAEWVADELGRVGKSAFVSSMRNRFGDWTPAFGEAGER